MDKETTSWLGRTKFSHTVYTSVGSHGLHVAPLGKDLEERLQKIVSMKKSMSMPVARDSEETVTTLKHTASFPSLGSALQSNKQRAKKKLSMEILPSPPTSSEKSKTPRARSLLKSPSSMMLLSYLNNAQTNQGSSLQKSDGPRHKPRSKSPLPSIVPSDVFREARAGSQRFTSPPPKRVGSEKSVYGKSLGRGFSDMDPSAGWCTTPLVSGKHKPPKGSLWTKKYFDGGGRRRVSAVDSTRGRRFSMAQAVQTTVDWTLNPSKLLVGDKFASGAYSQLYKGVYDEKPVAIKFTRQPANDENRKMGAMLEKQYNTEVNALSRLYHKNVIKVTNTHLVLFFLYPCSCIFALVFSLAYYANE